MYIGGFDVFIEDVQSDYTKRMGHIITKGANPAMTIFPVSMAYREFPVFV